MFLFLKPPMWIDALMLHHVSVVQYGFLRTEYKVLPEEGHLFTLPEELLARSPEPLDHIRIKVDSRYSVLGAVQPQSR